MTEITLWKVLLLLLFIYFFGDSFLFATDKIVVKLIMHILRFNF